MNHFCKTFKSEIPESLCVKRIDSKEYPLCLSCDTGLVIAAGFDRSEIVPSLRPARPVKGRNPFRPEKRKEKEAAARGMRQSHRKRYSGDSVLKAQIKYASDLLAAELRQLTMIKARLDLLIDLDRGAE